MQRVGEFEKVSFEQFRDAMKDEFYRGQELPPAIEDDLRKMWEEIALPSRATTGSAGYDFKAPFTFEMRPGETMKIPTGIRVKIDEGWWLGCLPRSGLGFKFRMQLTIRWALSTAIITSPTTRGTSSPRLQTTARVKRLCTLKPVAALCRQSSFRMGLHTPMMQPASETAVWAPRTARRKRNHT